jgi:hypothetical protein
MTAKKHYRLPDGKITTSHTRYLREWRRVARPIEKAFPGYKLDAFDPGLRFTCVSKDGVWDIFSISVQAVKCLLTGAKPRK